MQSNAYIEFLEKAKNVYLSENYSLYDLTYSKTAIDNGISNIPSNEIKNNLIFLCVTLLEPLTILFNQKLNITSGYRNEQLNKLVGGSPNSKHLQGLAIDFKPKGIGLRPSIYKIKLSDINFDSLILEFGWIHISAIKNGNRRQVYEAVKGTNGNINYLPFFDKF